MERYDTCRVLPAAGANAAALALMQRFMVALASGDAEAVIGLLRDDAAAINDGAGVHYAALEPVRVWQVHTLVAPAKLAPLF